MTLADLLQWFQRFRAPPGRPARALGIPAKEDELERELEPLLGQLDEIADEASSLRKDAHSRAQELLAAADRRSSELLSSAREHAHLERVRAAEVWIRAAESESEAMIQEAVREAARIEQQGEKRIPAVLASVSRCIEASAQ